MTKHDGGKTLPKVGAAKGTRWVIRWDWTGGHATEHIDTTQVFVLSGRLSQEQVLRFAELVYIDRFFTIAERLEYSKGGKWFRRMRSSLFQEGQIEGVPYLGSFIFGHNPFLTASLARNISVDEGHDGKQVLRYDCIRPSIKG